MCISAKPLFGESMSVHILYIYIYVMFNKSTFEQLGFPIATFDFQRYKRACQCIMFFTFLFIWFLATHNSKMVGTVLIGVPQVRSIAEICFLGVTGMTHDSVSPNATGYAPGGCWTFFWRMWMSVLPSPYCNILWKPCERNPHGMYRMSS